MKAINMTMIYSNKNYKGKWVALEKYESNPRVISYAKTLEETLREAGQKGFKHPVIMQIPKKVLPIVGVV
mgnify:CR=1 FL=1